MKKFLMAVLAVLTVQGCSSFQAQRVSLEEGDKRAMEITDDWLVTDTENTVKAIMEKLDTNKSYQKWLRQLGHEPKVFIAEIQNDTNDAYFPLGDISDALLEALSESGDYVLIDAAARERLLKEIHYQNDGMVKSEDIKKIGRQTGAEALIFGRAFVRPATRNGKTIKEFTINLRITDLEKGIEIGRVRYQTSKYSKQGGFGL